MKKIAIISAALTITITATACSNSNTALVSQTVASQENSSDPVAQLKTLIQERETYISNGGVWNNRSIGWARVSAKVADVQYDVRKTDSLVSPYTGIATFNVIMSSDFFATESEARGTDTGNAKDSSKPSSLKCRYTYAYQEGKWVVKQQESLLASPGEEHWVPFSGERNGATIACGVAQK